MKDRVMVIAGNAKAFDEVNRAYGKYGPDFIKDTEKFVEVVNPMSNNFVFVRDSLKFVNNEVRCSWVESGFCYLEEISSPDLEVTWGNEKAWCGWLSSLDSIAMFDMDGNMLLGGKYDDLGLNPGGDDFHEKLFKIMTEAVRSDGRNPIDATDVEELVF